MTFNKSSLVKTFLTLVLGVICNTGFSQMSYHQDMFAGGVTHAGYSPAHWQTAPVQGIITLNIPAGVTIRNAFLIAGRLGNVAPTTVTLSGTPLVLNAGNQASPTFNTLYGGPSGVHVVNVTALMTPGVNTYSLNLPNQANTSNRYQDFYLFCSYNSNAMQSVSTAIFLNTLSSQATHNWGTLTMINPFNLSSGQVGYSFCAGYSCFFSDGERPIINGTNLGTTWGQDINSGFCGGPVGSMWYNNGVLNQLSDDNVNQAQNGPEALSNISALVTPNANTLTLSHQHQSGGQDNHPWAGVFVWSSCNVPTVTAVASKTAFCNGQSATLTAAGAATYTWNPGNIVGPSIVVSPTSSVIYTVTGTGTNSCNNNTTVPIVIYANPTINAMSNNGPVCQGSMLNLGVAATTSASADYSWTGPNAYTANTQSPSIASAMPANGGFYTVTVSNTYTGAPYTTTAQCSVIGTMSVAVVPTAPLIVVPTFTICQGTNLNLTANAVGASSYSWTGMLNSALQNPNINNVNTAHSGDYSVTASFAIPSTTLICQSTAVSNVSVVARNPVMPFSSANVCQFATATFSANAVGAAGYSWNGPNGFTSSNQINSITNIQPVSSGNYTVNAIFTIGTVSCMTTGFIPINVVAVPSLAVIPTITVCERQGTSFSASAPNALNYIWSGPNSFTMNSPNPIFTNLTPSMSGIYTVTASFSNGNLTCYNSNQTNLLVKPIMPFELGPNLSMCSNSDLFLNGPAGATNYNWWGSTSYTSSTQALFVPGLGPNNSGIYVLEVDLNGCKTYDSVRVDILSPIVYTLTPNNRTICRGEKVDFVVGAAQGSENYAYTWNPAIYITSPTGSLQAGEPLGTTVYNISTYDIACPNYVIQTSFTVTVKQPPVPNVTLPATRCEPLCAIFNTKTQADAASVTYNFGNNHIVQGDSVNVCLNAGNHYMTIITAGTNGCKGTYEYTTPITVYPKPGADFTWNPETPNTSDNQVTFIPTVKNGKTFTYDWQFTNSTNVGGIDHSNTKNPTKLYDNNGKFPVMLVITNEYGCVDSLFKVVTIEEDVNVFIPNTFTPNDDNVNDVFNIKGVGLKSEGFFMQIFDRWGTLLYSSKDINKGWDGTVKGTKAADGVYVYVVKVVGGNGVGKKEFKGHVTLLK